jgi:hypothetical protein
MDPATRESVMALAPEGRFAYFVRKAADFEQVWGLHGDGWATTMGADGAIALAVWPEREFAAACAVGAWQQHVPEAVALGDFLTHWLPGLVRDSRRVDVFPTTKDAGTLASPDSLLEAIHREMWQSPGG